MGCTVVFLVSATAHPYKNGRAQLYCFATPKTPIKSCWPWQWRSQRKNLGGAKCLILGE